MPSLHTWLSDTTAAAEWGHLAEPSAEEESSKRYCSEDECTFRVSRCPICDGWGVMERPASWPALSAREIVAPDVEPRAS